MSISKKYLGAIFHKFKDYKVNAERLLDSGGRAFIFLPWRSHFPFDSCVVNDPSISFIFFVKSSYHFRRNKKIVLLDFLIVSVLIRFCLYFTPSFWTWTPALFGTWSKKMRSRPDKPSQKYMYSLQSFHTPTIVDPLPLKETDYAMKYLHWPMNHANEVKVRWTLPNKHVHLKIKSCIKYSWPIVYSI